MFRHPNLSTDLIILGGGAAATAALIELIQQLAKQPSKQPYTVTLIERTNIAGAGYPYNPTHHPATLKVNDSNAGMQLSKDADKLNDFVVWLKQNSETLKQKFPELAQIIDDNNNNKDRYAPRMLFGVYCRERLNEWIVKASESGIKVTIETNTNIVDVVKNKDHTWKLISDNGRTFVAHNLLLITGHLPSKKFHDLSSQPHYFDSPYADISHIPDEPVMVLGTGLSAIDAVKLLAQQKTLTAPIYMVSPSGQLPRIKGPANNNVYQMRFLTEKNLDIPNIPLTKVMELFVEEIKAATGNSAWDLAAIMRKVRQEGKDPVRALNNEIDLVEHSQIRDWQRMIGETFYVPLPLIWKNLAEGDRAEFISTYFPFFLKWAAGMTLSNAKELAALVNAGRVHIIQSANTVTFNTAKQKFELVTESGKKIAATTAINATGTGFDIKNSVVLNNMMQRGLIKQAKYIGGVDITNEFHLLDADNNSHRNAWAMGIVTFGCNLGAPSIEIAAMNAKSIAPQIAENMKLARQIAFPICKL